LVHVFPPTTLHNLENKYKSLQRNLNPPSALKAALKAKLLDAEGKAADLFTVSARDRTLVVTRTLTILGSCFFSFHIPQTGKQVQKLSAQS
jgi:hypothetical protein